jgi:hypothetical protein
MADLEFSPFPVDITIDQIPHTIATVTVTVNEAGLIDAWDRTHPGQPIDPVAATDWLRRRERHLQREVAQQVVQSLYNMVRPAASEPYGTPDAEAFNADSRRRHLRQFAARQSFMVLFDLFQQPLRHVLPDAPRLPDDLERDVDDHGMPLSFGHYYSAAIDTDNLPAMDAVQKYLRSGAKKGPKERHWTPILDAYHFTLLAVRALTSAQADPTDRLKCWRADQATPVGQRIEAAGLSDAWTSVPSRYEGITDARHRPPHRRSHRAETAYLDVGRRSIRRRSSRPASA